MRDLETIAQQMFRQALLIAAEERAPFLDRACSDEPILRQLVEEMLAEADNANTSQTSSSGWPPMPTAPGMQGLQRGFRLGRYLILEPIGSGGMGLVYRARDEKLQRDVAIKILSPGLMIGKQARDHFRHEALALAKLNHPNIAAIYDVGEQNDLDFIVMELVSGESLASKLNLGPLGIDEATGILLRIALALEEAHERGLVHRDLKPANIMISQKGEVKVLDFGIAKLLTPQDLHATASIADTGQLIGTLLYMSPEQASGESVDAQTDLWSLGIVYYEALTGRSPFAGVTGVAVLLAITESSIPAIDEIRPGFPSEVKKIVSTSLQKDKTKRYKSSREMANDARNLLDHLHGLSTVQRQSGVWKVKTIALTMVVTCIAVLASAWAYHRHQARVWARTDAISQAEALLNEHRPLAALSLLEKAEQILPDEPRIKLLMAEHSAPVTVTSEPSGASVQIEDYLAPAEEWKSLGTTPLNIVNIPKGYFRWKIAKTGFAEIVMAPEISPRMDFHLELSRVAPSGMVYAAGGEWSDYSAFIGWLGPYKLPPYYVDQFEVTNRQYQVFVDSGGYAKQKLWPAIFDQHHKHLGWSQAMLQFRDTTGRPGPSTWVAGHFPEGQGDFPVTGVSWFEASAYARFAGKSLPVLGQWYQTAPPDVAEYAVLSGNITTKALAPVGKYQQLGPFGTFDTAGNVREWVANVVDDDLRFILGGSWQSQAYLYVDPEALSPFDRSPANGFRCVRNLAPLPEEAVQPVHRVTRDFSTFKPVTDEVFRAYKLLYEYEKTPLNAQVEGVIKETADWREEKISYDTAYHGERMSAYLFLPKRVRPPYQTILFFPSARVLFLPGDSSNLGDTKFFDYAVQSGRAVMYPVYQDMYERRIKYRLPSGSESVDLATEWYKDASRSLDYLNTRADIDSSRIAYLGVSMGSADGIIFSTLLQDRLSTAVLLDGGYFLQKAPAGIDQADFAPHMKKPVLMVNGRYDYTFPVEKAQAPMFDMLGTPAADKKHVLLDTPHDVTEAHTQLVTAVLSWLDKYLGQVQD